MGHPCFVSCFLKRKWRSPPSRSFVGGGGGDRTANTTADASTVTAVHLSEAYLYLGLLVIPLCLHLVPAFIETLNTGRCYYYSSYIAAGWIWLLTLFVFAEEK